MAKILNLRADLQDKWSVISYNSAIRKWENEKEQIDNDFIRDIARWENDCTVQRLNMRRRSRIMRISEENRADYPEKLKKAGSQAAKEDERLNMLRKSRNMNLQSQIGKKNEE